MTTVDDNALQYVAATLLDSKYKIVFCGINGDPVSYGVANTLDRPAHNITGVIERQPVLSNIRLMHDVLGGPREVVIFFDASNSSMHMKQYLDQQLNSEEGGRLLQDTGMRIREVFVSNNWTAWRQKILHYQSSDDVAFFFFSYDTVSDQGTVLTPFDIMQWVYDHSRIPDFGLHIESGGIAGYGNSGYGQGYGAAMKVRQILGGAAPGNIPIELPKSYYLSINPKRARQLGIQIPFKLLAIAKVL